MTFGGSTTLGGVLEISDTDFPLFPWERLYQGRYLWSPDLGGRVFYRWFSELPLHAATAFLSVMGVPLWLVNRLWPIASLTLMGCSMYYLTSIFVQGKHEFVSCLAASLFFILNPHVTNRISAGQYVILFSCAGLVLFLAYSINGLRTASTKYLVFAGISSIMMSIYIPLAVIGVLLVLSYLIFHSLDRKRATIQSTLRMGTLLLVVFFAVNAWWLIPAMHTALKENIIAEIYSGETVPVLEYYGRLTSLLWIIHPFWDAPEEPIYLFSGFGLVILAYSSLLFRPKDGYKRHLVWYLSFLAITSTLLATGIHYPRFAVLYLWLFNNVPLFQMFRSPLKFITVLVLAYAGLIAINTQRLLVLGKRVTHSSLLIIPAISLLIVANSVPYLNGRVRDFSILSPVTVPSDYYELREYLAQKAGSQVNGFRVLIIPWEAYVHYTWSPYPMTDVIDDLSPVPILAGERPFGVMKLLYESLDGKDPEASAQLLGLLNVKYVVLHKDLRDTDVSSLRSLLSGSPFFQRVKEWENLDLYELDDAHLHDHLYVSSDPILIEGTFTDVKGVIEDDLSPRHDALFLSDQLDAQQIELVRSVSEGGDSKILQDIRYQKIDPTKYTVELRAVTPPILLVLGESYDRNWIAYVGGEEIPTEYHLVANGYSNAWYIDSAGSGLAITLSFWPQQLVYLGSMVSVATLMVMFAFLLRKKLTE